MNGGVLVFCLLVLLFGWRWLSAVLHLSGPFITSQQGHFGLCPAVSSAQAAPFACGWLLGRDELYLSQELSLPRYGTQGRKITSTVLKTLMSQQEFIDHTHKLIFIQKPPFRAANSIFFRTARLLSTISEPKMYSAIVERNAF